MHLKFGRKSYLYHNIRKIRSSKTNCYAKTYFYVLYLGGKNKSYVKDPKTEINIQIDSIKCKIMILENFRKNKIKSGAHMIEKYQLHILIPD